ncbi:hypothetical protein BIY24_04965 [Halobacteriovorax marinus]|uniref:hypothetical protein n=1 Tax=Halobacteriovorax marinus TaxID=97084 RepID=UPI000BC34678|nr:hypothetical protein [Halobacteriovorax marinus]ATH07309.1 hypothetical protein BIY24_04965 [Halobacteriovorax marinus]
MKKFWNDTFYINSLTEKEESIVGTLNPIRWDKNGEIKQFSIYSTDEEDIIIEGYPKKRKLIKMLNKRVLAKGKVRIDENGDKFIKINNIKEISGPGAPVNSFIRPIEPSLWNEEYSLSIPKEYALAQYGQANETFWEAC